MVVLAGTHTPWYMALICKGFAIIIISHIGNDLVYQTENRISSLITKCLCKTYRYQKSNDYSLIVTLLIQLSPVMTACSSKTL